MKESFNYSVDEKYVFHAGKVYEFKISVSDCCESCAFYDKNNVLCNHPCVTSDKRCSEIQRLDKGNGYWIEGVLKPKEKKQSSQTEAEKAMCDLLLG